MCTREELNSLIRELLRHIEQVALLGAKIQFDEELKLNKPVEYLTCSDKTKNYVRNNAQNARFKQVARFHMAYLKYFVFALDPYAEIIVPLSSSSLALFITNIMSKMAPSSQQMPFHHTSKTIIEFLQVQHCNRVYWKIPPIRKRILITFFGDIFCFSRSSTRRWCTHFTRNTDVICRISWKKCIYRTTLKF